MPHFPRAGEISGFPRWRFALWLLYYVEDALGRLPILLLGPVLGAVIGTAIAVSELSSVRIDGRVAAAVPSTLDVLWPAVVGGVSGIAALAVVMAGWGAFRYSTSGDDVWQGQFVTFDNGGGAAELVCKATDPVSTTQLGAIECVLRYPSGDFETAGALTPRHNPNGVIAAGHRALNEPGEHEVRWYATEQRPKLHEVARVRFVVDG
jgi:hypothetical protein